MHKISSGILLCFLAVLGSSLPGNNRQLPQERKVTRYVNCDYGYVVRIPTGLVGRVPEYQNHGFYVNLPDGKSTIRSYNAFNMSDSVSSRKVFEYELKLQAEGKVDWKIASRYREQVQGLDAINATATYRCKGTRWMSRYLLIYRPFDQEGLGNIVYLFELSTPLARYKETSLAFDRVVGGFELTKLPRGPCSNG